MRTIIFVFALEFFSAAAHAAPGTGHFTIKGDLNASFAIAVKDCVAMRPGDSLMNGLSVGVERNEMIAVGTMQIPVYAGDKTYARRAPSDKSVRFSFHMHKTARDREFFEVDVREGAPGLVTAKITNGGKTGKLTFEGVNLTRFGAKKGAVSGEINWDCASLQKL